MHTSNLAWAGVMLAAIVRPLCAQMETITLQNGATFTGRIAMEAGGFVELEMSHGRVRLHKDWIAERRRDLPRETKTPPREDPPRALRTPPTISKSDKKKPPGGPSDTKPPEILLDTGVLGIGSVAARIPAGGGAPTPATRTAQTFCCYLLGLGDLAPLEEIVDADAVLSNAFRSEYRSLTAYTRRSAQRVFLASLSAMFKRPYIQSAYEDARQSIRTVDSHESYELVEVTFHRGTGLDERIILGIKDGRIVDLNLGPMPLPGWFKDVRTALADTTSGVTRNLAQVIQEFATAEVGKATVDQIYGATGLTDPSVFKPRDPESRFFVTLNPKQWVNFDHVASKRNLDLVIRASDRSGCIAIKSEPFRADPQEIMKASLLNLKDVSGAVVVTSQREAQVGPVPALHFNVDATVSAVELTYSVLVFTVHGRSYQLAGWCRRGDISKFQRHFETVQSQLHILEF